MQLKVPILSDTVTRVAYAVAGIVVATIVISKLSSNRRLAAIPTIGESSWPLSWWVGHKFQTNAEEVIQEGYQKYKSTPFKVPDRRRWIVVVGGRQHLEELRKAPKDVLSFLDAANDSMGLQYSMGPEYIQNPYHIEIIRARLTRNLGDLYDEIHDEISVAFDQVLDLKDSEWKCVPVMGAILGVISRASNRAFVGLPLCRNPDWTDLNVRFTLELMAAASVFRRFPGFLAPIVAHFVAGPRNVIKRCMQLLAPVIEERLKLHEHDRLGERNDLLSWLLDEAPEGPERTVRQWTIRFLGTNFAAIHSSGNSFSQALFFLAENPQYIQPLREEVEAIVEKEGWSRASLAKMHKIDSFLKECQRLTASGALGMTRLALKDFTFSDGTFIPKGTLVSVPARSLHFDNAHYENAHVFNPFRFSDMHDVEGEDTNLHLASTSTEYLPFGHGKQAWYDRPVDLIASRKEFTSRVFVSPGRFFAATQLKSMLAHVVVSYDIKLEDARAESVGTHRTPDHSAKLLFRRRVY